MSHLINNYKTIKQLSMDHPEQTNPIVITVPLESDQEGVYTISQVSKNSITGQDNGTNSDTFTVESLNELLAGKDAAIQELNDHKESINQLLLDIA